VAAPKILSRPQTSKAAYAPREPLPAARSGLGRSAPAGVATGEAAVPSSGGIRFRSSPVHRPLGVIAEFDHAPAAGIPDLSQDTMLGPNPPAINKRKATHVD
jgi:hypothetical protein